VQEDLDVLIHRVAEERGWNLVYVQLDDVYKLQLQTPGERWQDVFVTFRRDQEEAWVATIWSTIADVADFDLRDPLELLRFNWRNVYGALAVKDGEVVLVQNQLADDADLGEVAKAIHWIGTNADSIEKTIYGDRDER
jgi:hypothetical protein